MSYHVSINELQPPPFVVDMDLLRRAVCTILEHERVDHGTISVAIVDNPTIHQLNRQYLNHDYPTDVLSFVLERDLQALEGEIVVSAQMAADQAQVYGWSGSDELLLYVIHGTLHLVGYDDLSPPLAQRMRERESFYLSTLGRPERQPLAGPIRQGDTASCTAEGDSVL